MARRKKVKLLTQLPAAYTADYMERLDKRTALGKAVTQLHASVVADAGGDLTTVKQSLARRHVWCEVMLQGIECRMAAGQEVDVGSWTQLVNSQIGLARMLGLERRPRNVRTLRDVMNGAPRAPGAAA